MIAPFQEHTVVPREHLRAIDNEERQQTSRINRIIAAQPVAAVVVAVTIGAGIGWLIKRKLA